MRSVTTLLHKDSSNIAVWKPKYCIRQSEKQIHKEGKDQDGTWAYDRLKNRKSKPWKEKAWNEFRVLRDGESCHSGTQQEASRTECWIQGGWEIGNSWTWDERTARQCRIQRSEKATRGVRNMRQREQNAEYRQAEKLATAEHRRVWQVHAEYRNLEWAATAAQNKRRREENSTQTGETNHDSCSSRKGNDLTSEAKEQQWTVWLTSFTWQWLKGPFVFAVLVVCYFTDPLSKKHEVYINGPLSAQEWLNLVQLVHILLSGFV